jgi:hypothetical protein
MQYATSFSNTRMRENCPKIKQASQRFKRFGKTAFCRTFGRIGDRVGNTCSQAGFDYIDHTGLVVAWECATANVADNTFQRPIWQVEEQMIVLSDTAFHAAEGAPTNLKLCPCGAWQDRLLVETVLSRLTVVCHFKRVMHRVWRYFYARLACTMAAFNVLVQWHGFQPYASGFVPLSMAKFSL